MHWNYRGLQTTVIKKFFKGSIAWINYGKDIGKKLFMDIQIINIVMEEQWKKCRCCILRIKDWHFLQTPLRKPSTVCNFSWRAMKCKKKVNASKIMYFSQTKIKKCKILKQQQQWLDSFLTKQWLITTSMKFIYINLTSSMNFLSMYNNVISKMTWSPWILSFIFVLFTVFFDVEDPFFFTPKFEVKNLFVFYKLKVYMIYKSCANIFKQAGVVRLENRL